MPGSVLNGQYSGKCFLVNQKDLFEKVIFYLHGRIVESHRVLKGMCSEAAEHRL